MNEARKKLLPLYRKILKSGSGFKDYNIKSYIKRKAKQDFEKLKEINDEKALQQFLEDQTKYIDVLNRQKIVQNMYHSGKKVIETKS